MNALGNRIQTDWYLEVTIGRFLSLYGLVYGEIINTDFQRKGFGKIKNVSWAGSNFSNGFGSIALIGILVHLSLPKSDL